MQFHDGQRVFYGLQRKDEQAVGVWICSQVDPTALPNLEQTWYASSCASLLQGSPQALHDCAAGYLGIFLSNKLLQVSDSTSIFCGSNKDKLLSLPT